MTAIFAIIENGYINTVYDELCYARWLFYASPVISNSKQTIGRRRCIWTAEWGNCTSLGRDFPVLWGLYTTRHAAVCLRLVWVKPAPTVLLREELCGNENTWTSLTQSGKARNIWNPQSLRLRTSSEKMDGFTDVPDRLINPMASASLVYFPKC